MPLNPDSSKCYFSDTSKEKLGDSDDLGGSSGMGPSAALTPAIWDKTIPYDGENFHLEYMDLEEFLMENGIPSLPGEESTKVGPEGNDSNTEEVKSPKVTLLPSEELDVCQKEVVTITSSDSDIICDVTTGENGEHKDITSYHVHIKRNISYNPGIKSSVFVCYHISVDSEVTTENETAAPEPIDPDEIEITVNYDPDPTDLVLSSVPGGELFDPRKHKFSEEDLKPQPMIKKAKKVFVPEEQKVSKQGFNGMKQLIWCLKWME